MRYTRLILVDVGTGTMSRLFGRTDVVEGDNVIHYAEDGSYILVSIQKSIYDYPAVIRHELKPNGKIYTEQQPRDGVWNWVADNNGVVRMGTGWLGGQFKVFYRSDATGELELVARVKDGQKTTDRYWDAVQIIGGSDEGYVLSEGETGRVGLRRYNFATRTMVETIYEHPEWDIDAVGIQDGKPYAVYYTADRDEVHYLDPELAKQHVALRNAIGEGEIWVPSRAKDGARMLVRAGSEADPGLLYMYEPAAQRMDEIAQYRPAIDYQALAKPRPMRYSARDVAVIGQRANMAKIVAGQLAAAQVLVEGGLRVADLPARRRRANDRHCIALSAKE